MGLMTAHVATGMPAELDAERRRIDAELARLIAGVRATGPERDHPLIARVYGWTRHYLDNGGQRMHGLAVLLAYRACGGQHAALALRVAAALQLYHHHTLVHDDVYDEDEARRGWPTTHRAFADWIEARHGAPPDGAPSPTRLFSTEANRRGAITAFAYGKVCRALAGSAIAGCGAPADTALAITLALENHDLYDNAAQLADVFHEARAMPSPQVCMRNADLKTGRLFELCAESGARLAGAQASQTQALQDWAGASALAYQLQDDLEDLEEASEKGQGRGVATDLLHCKPTYLYAMAEQCSADDDRAVLQRWRSGVKNDLSTADVMQALHRSGAVQACRAEVARCVARALAAIDECVPAIDATTAAQMRAFSEHFVSPAYWHRRLPANGHQARDLLA